MSAVILELPRTVAGVRVANEIRGLCKQHGLSPRQEQKAVRRFIETEAGHSVALATMDARKVIRSYETMIGQAPTGGAA